MAAKKTSKKPGIVAPDADGDFDMSWRAPEDARTLQQADAIRNDKQRMKHVTNHVTKLNSLIAPAKKPANKARGKSK